MPFGDQSEMNTIPLIKHVFQACAFCRNMSGHSRWAVQPLDWRRWYSKINLYVVVGSYAKDDDFPCNGCYFLVYQFRKKCVDTRFFRTEIVYLESNVIQCMTPRTNVSS